MRPAILPPEFFARSTITVARELLGKTLVVRHGDEIQARVITETEAYIGPNDKACHAHRGQTKRNQVMFGPAGYWYVYFIYGLFWMLNVVTETENHPSAVLFRGVEGFAGPARLTKNMGIDRRFNGCPATEAGGMWIEDRGLELSSFKIRKGPRVGIDYSGAYWKRRHLRFWIERKEGTGDRE